MTDVTEADAEGAADLWRVGSALSLADRLCMALGRRLNLIVATTDAAWRAVDGRPEIVLIR